MDRERRNGYVKREVDNNLSSARQRPIMYSKEVVKMKVIGENDFVLVLGFLRISSSSGGKLNEIIILDCGGKDKASLHVRR